MSAQSKPSPSIPKIKYVITNARGKPKRHPKSIFLGFFDVVEEIDGIELHRINNIECAIVNRKLLCTYPEVPGRGDRSDEKFSTVHPASAAARALCNVLMYDALKTHFAETKRTATESQEQNVQVAENLGLTGTDA